MNAGFHEMAIPGQGRKAPGPAEALPGILQLPGVQELLRRLLPRVGLRCGAGLARVRQQAALQPQRCHGVSCTHVQQAS